MAKCSRAASKAAGRISDSHFRTLNSAAQQPQVHAHEMPKAQQSLELTGFQLARLVAFLWPLANTSRNDLRRWKNASQNWKHGWAA